MADLKDKLWAQQQRLPEIPLGYPQGHPVSGEWQLPLLKPVLAPDPTLDAIGFDDRKRVKNPSNSIVHFYRDDMKFMGLLLDPKKWVYRFMDFGYVITPDISLGDEMPEWLIAHRTFYSRAVGAIWQSRGLKVVPNLRWRRLEQIPHIVQGLPSGSTIAFSNYGFRRSAKERKLFHDGLVQIISFLKPSTVVIFGSLDNDLTQALLGVPQVIVLSSPLSTKSKSTGPRLPLNPDRDHLF